MQTVGSVSSIHSLGRSTKLRKLIEQHYCAPFEQRRDAGKHRKLELRSKSNPRLIAIPSQLGQSISNFALHNYFNRLAGLFVGHVTAIS